MSNQAKGNLLIFMTAFFWSFMGIIGKYAASNGIIVCSVAATVAFVIVFLFYRKHRFRFNRASIMGACFMSATTITFNLAIKYTTVTNTIVLQYCSPIFVVIYSIILLHYRPKRIEVLTLSVCFIGMIIFFYDQLTSGHMIGNILAIISGLVFAASFFINAMPKTDSITSTVMSQMFSACFGYIVWGIMALMGHGEGMFVVKDLPILMMSGFLAVGLPGITYATGMRWTSALNANMISLSEVFMAPIWAKIIFDEKMGRYSGIGIVMMVTSIVAQCVINNRNLKQ